MSCYLEAMQMGAADYLEKPVPPGDLLRFIRTHLQYEKLAQRQTSA
jgi:DNA-binding NtrC family response regulator